MLRQTNQATNYRPLPKTFQEDEAARREQFHSNQKRILETYAKQNGFSNLRWYTDDGYSGANFQRPPVFKPCLQTLKPEKSGQLS